MILLILYAFFSVIGFLVMGYDKYLSIQFAKRGEGYRVPERVLLGLAFVGGVGVWLGMYVFHHKTKKPKFYLGVPLLCVTTLLILQWIFL